MECVVVVIVNALFFGAWVLFKYAYGSLMSVMGYETKFVYIGGSGKVPRRLFTSYVRRPTACPSVAPRVLSDDSQQDGHEVNFLAEDVEWEDVCE